MNSCNRTFTLATEKNLVTVVIFHADEEPAAGSSSDSGAGWNFPGAAPLLAPRRLSHRSRGAAN